MRERGEPFPEDDYEFFCDRCDTHVSDQSKHCRRCNRCTLRFDHHCIWLNNCIGSSNYSVFLALIISFGFLLIY
jgi:palmitoyltransferase